MNDPLVALLCRTSPLAVLALFAGFSLPQPALQQTPPPDLDEDGALTIVHLDIKPGSCPNPLNVDQASSADDELELIDGVLVSALRVSVLGNKFDVSQISLNSVGLSLSGVDGGPVVYPIQLVFADNGTPFIGEGCECHALAGDGVLDLSLKFDKNEVVKAFELEFEEDGADVGLQVTGLVEGVQEFRGRDCVRIINH